MKKTLTTIIAAVCAASLAFAAPRKAADITVSGYTGASTLENFPVLVRISPARISGFSYADCAAGGADISFVAADGETVLAHEIDTWDTSGESLVWVRLPSLSGTGTTFTLRWNDANPPSVTASDVWNPYVGVWHMDESSGAVADATGHALAATPMGNTENSIAIAGPVGNARQTATSAAKGYLSIPNYNSFGLGGTFTMSGWVKLTGCTAYPRLFSRKESYTAANGWEIEMSSGSFVNFGARGANNPGYTGTFPATLQNSWSHVVLVYSGTTLTVYQNGAQIKTGTINAATDNGLPLSIGCDSDGSETYAQGAFDECRLMGGAANADWVKAEYDSMEGSSFLTYGAAFNLSNNSMIRVFGAPSEIGSPTPAYGPVNNLSANDSMSLSMAATVVPGDGTVTNYLIGWTLEMVDTDTEARTPIRSSSDSGESIDYCAYVHASYAEFTWLWSVRDVLGVGAPTLATSTQNTLTLSVPVEGFGYNADSATLKIAYGVSPNALVHTNVVSSSVTSVGAVQATLTRLAPGSACYARAILEANDAGHEVAASETVCFVTAQLDETPAEPGLWQTFFTSANADWTKDIWSVPEGTDWLKYTDADRIRRRELTPIGAYTGGGSVSACTKYTSEVWGDDVYWPANGGQWVYAGYIYLEASKSYMFRMKIDDNERIQITDAATGVTTALLEDKSNGSGVNTSAAYSPSVTGWHAIEIRMSDGTGGLGGYDKADNYVNSNNLGFSQDGGSTWSILKDTGDGSLLRTTDGGMITATENVAGGGLVSIAIDFPASSTARTLRVAWGPVHGGGDPSDWYATGVAANVPAGATSAVWTPPADWGSDSNLVARFYFSGPPADWSNSIFWRDYSAPGIANLAVDGTGGDTLVVSGDLVSFPGPDCVLTVYVGDSPTGLDAAWTGLAGATRTATGAFSLTLFEPDANSARYLEPGSTRYVTVEAVSGGRVSRTAVQEVTMSAAPVFASSASSVARRTVTFSGSLADVGAGGTATVTLYVGSSDNEAALTAAESTILTANGAFTIVHTFPDFETIYWWQFRATAEAAGGTADFETRTAVASCKTLDTTTYTWKTSVSSGNWDDPANWTDNQNGDSFGYPQSTSATATFPAMTDASVAFQSALSIGTLNLGANSIAVRFVQGGASTNETRLSANTLNLNGKGGAITLDGVAITTGGGATLAAYRALNLVNAANLHMGGDFYIQETNDVTVANGSWLSCNQVLFGGGTITIDDATVWTRNHDYVGRNRVGGRLLFKGANPLWRHSNKDCYFFSNLANANVQLDFLVPAGGFAAAPIQAPSNQNYYMANNGNSAGSSSYTVNVLDESPANFADATATYPLISWPKGINKALFNEGHLPEDGAATDDSFVWNDPEAANPANLSVRIVGSSHAGQLQVTGAPEAFESAELSPAYGYTALAENANVTCTAPASHVQISADKRAVCTGWKLYDVNASTLVRTLADSGDTTTASVTGTGLWRELEWQWRIEYRVAVSAGAGGTAAAADEWVADGALATVTATPDTGYALYKWTGDVDANHDKEKTLTFAIDGHGYALSAVFAQVFYVSKTGNDANDGLSWATAKATIPAAVALSSTPYVLVSNGVYEITSAIQLTKGAIVEGTGDRGAVIKLTATPPDGDSTRCAVYLNHADAALRNLAVCGTYTERARGICIDAGGLVENCSVTNNRTVNNNQSGAGIYLKAGGIVRGCLVEHNLKSTSGGAGGSGGGIHMKAGLVENCVIRDNRVDYGGGGAAGGGVYVEGGTLRNSLVTGNYSAHYLYGPAGAGVTLKSGTLENCTIVGNFNRTSTGVVGLHLQNGTATVRNCIIWGNENISGVKANWTIDAGASPALENNCSYPAFPGTGNTAADPLFRDFENGDYHPTLGSARNAGVLLNWMAGVTDIDGNPRVAEGAPDIGCHEYVPAALDCSFDVSAGGTLDSDDVTLTATVGGSNLAGLVYRWTLTDSDGNVTARTGADLAETTLTLGPGIYSITLEVENGAHDAASYSRSEVVTVHPSHIYVDVNGANVMPFGSYANGATNILDAVAFATGGTTIHVADGFYRHDSEIVLNDAIRVVSENGPTNAILFCSRAPLALNAVTLANQGAVLSGLTLTGIDFDNPASGTHSIYDFLQRKPNGTAPGAQPRIHGGVGITSDGGTVTNCFITNHNGDHKAAANISGGYVVDCLFTNNWNYCSGGGGSSGGGINVDGANAFVERCTFLSNFVYDGGVSYGGGANVNSGTLRNCLFIGNQCTKGYGGNIAASGSGRVYHCTAVDGYGSLGNGGIYVSGNAVVDDCISYHNVGNTTDEDTDDPGFANYPDDLHLSGASTAVDAATSGMGGDLDLDWMPRVSGPAADKGCYEYDKSQFDIGISYSTANSFSDTPVTLSAVVTPAGTLLDESQTWWTFDGSEPTAGNHDATGSEVTRSFALGTWTVRFKTIYNGQTYARDKTDWFTRYGRTVHLVRENPDAAFPYGTPETAATNISDAVASAMDGATILVGDGTFDFSDGVKYIGNNLVIRSQNGPGSTTFDAKGKSAMFYIRSGDWKVVIDGIRFVNGSGYVDGGAIRMNDADSVVTNCVFDTCKTSSYGGAGLYMEGGTVVDCLFTNCWMSGNQSPVGVALKANGASCLIDRCIVLDTHFTHAATDVSRGAVSVNNGIVRNTVVSGSRLTGEAGIYAEGTAKVQNCTVADNVSTLSGYTAGVKVLDSATVKNTILWNNVNDADGARAEMGGDAGRFAHCFMGNPVFVGQPGREFLLRSNSPCRKAGQNESWMTGALDVYGQPRIANPKHPVDIGASECQITDATFLLMR